MKNSEKSKSTQDKIFRAAGECFAQKGYSACSMQDIAERAGVSKGALYGHCSGKEELFKQIIIREHARGAMRAKKAAENGPYIEAIITYMKECIQDFGFPVDHRLWIEALAVSSRDQEMRQAFMESEKDARNFFKILIQKGIASGEIDVGIDVEGVSILLFALGDGLIARIADDPEYDFQKHFAVFEAVVRNALRNKGKDKMSKEEE